MINVGMAIIHEQREEIVTFFLLMFQNGLNKEVTNDKTCVEVLFEFLCKKLGWMCEQYVIPMLSFLDTIQEIPEYFSHVVILDG